MKTDLFSPRRLLLVTLLSLFAAELVVMQLFSFTPPLQPYIESLADASLLSLCAIPLLYFFLYRPLLANIQKRNHAEVTLNKYTTDLEAIVEERCIKLVSEFKEREEREQDLTFSNKALATTNSLLRLALEDFTLEELLQLFIEKITALPELNLSNKGAIFTTTEGLEHLTLKGSYNLAQPLHELCKTVHRGQCLCGRAFDEGKVIFANCIDNRHDVTFDGISDHGHYCVPIYTTEKKICGVFTVYIDPGEEHNQAVEDFLVSASTIAGVFIQHKLTLQEQKDSAKKYSAITNTANDAIIMMNSKGRISYWNPAAAIIFGYTSDEAIGQDLHQLITPSKFHNAAMKNMASFKQTGEGDAIGKTLELTGLKKDGTEFPVELSLSAFYENNCWSAVGIVRDITDRKNADEERVNLQNQLRKAQKMESIGTLAGGIAHDFNNILTSVIGYGALIKEAVKGDIQLTDDIEQVLSAADRAKSLVRQILTFSRQKEQELMPIRIGLVIKEALKLLRASIPANIEIKQNIPGEEANVLADPTQIHQVVMNLCTNAYQAMKDGGVLDVSLYNENPPADLLTKHPGIRGNKFTCLRISDNGIGMDANTVSRIFEPYFSTKKKEDGTGLGLAVVHGIVMGMGGGLNVDSSVGEGTTFSIYIPQFEEQLIDTDSAEDKPPMPTGSEHIFYVDDELSITNVAKRHLKSLGYTVTTRTSSVEALKAFRNHPERYDLVITDHSMPNMNGDILAMEILKTRPEIPIVICTGYAGNDLIENSVKLTISEIINKPVSKEELATTVRNIFDEAEKSA